MNTYGNPNEVAFRVGPSTHGKSFKHVQIVVANTVLVDEPNTYVPGFLGGLVPATRSYEMRLNWLEHEATISRFSNLTEAHNALLHGDTSGFLRDEDRWRVAEFLQIFDYGCPETDGFVAYLLPYCGSLYITFQRCSDGQSGYERSVCVDGTKVAHFPLILAQRQTINELAEWV